MTDLVLLSITGVDENNVEALKAAVAPGHPVRISKDHWIVSVPVGVNSEATVKVIQSNLVNYGVTQVNGPQFEDLKGQADPKEIQEMEKAVTTYAPPSGDGSNLTI